MALTLAHPWFLLLLLLLPMAAWWRGRQGKPAAFLYSSVQLVSGVANINRSGAGRTLAALRWLTLALFIIGMARPQFVESETAVKASGIDIVVAIDLSGSMEAEDFELNRQRVNRLVIAKDVLKKFVEKRPGDRIGLVAFAGKAYVAAPLTLDHDFLQMNIDRLELRTIEDGTAIGSGLSAAINRLRDLKAKSKIVILLTDGQNNAGKVPPQVAAEAAKTLGYRVYTIGAGTRGSAPFPQVDAFGRRVYVNMPVDIDEDTLKEVAQTTGGRYFRATDTPSLQQIYDEIDQLEKSPQEGLQYLEYHELYVWLALPALLLLAGEALLAHTWLRVLP